MNKNNEMPLRKFPDIFLRPPLTSVWIFSHNINSHQLATSNGIGGETALETGKIKTTERSKIRTYIMGLIYRSGGSPIKVPSSAELAAQFGVARRTARIALEGLVREGWLIGKRGLGTFTNPARAFNGDAEDRIPLVGLIYGPGDHFFYDTPACRMLSEMGLAAAGRGFNTRLFARMPGNEECLFREIRDSNPDGLIWASCRHPSVELLEKLRGLGIRIVTIDREVPGFSSVLFDGTKAVEQVAERLAAEGRRDIVHLRRESDIIRMLVNSIAKQPGPSACREAAYPPHGLRETLAGLFEQRKPDALIIGWSNAAVVAELLRGSGIDPADGCRIIVEEDFAASVRLPCIVLDRPYRKAAEAAAAEIARQLQEEGSGAQTVRTDVELKYRDL